jgi:hypothetical protein
VGDIMKNKINVYLIILLFLIPVSLPITTGDSFKYYNKNFIECNNPILQFYFDEQNKTLFLKNIGDETAYNISISIQLDGFIILGFGNSGFLLGITALEPGEEKYIIKIFPLVLGLGPIYIIYTATAPNADPTSITLKGTLLGFFIFNLRLWERI